MSENPRSTRSGVLLCDDFDGLPDGEVCEFGPGVEWCDGDPDFVDGGVL